MMPMPVAYNMSGGGTAPAMKMSDVFILVSISILVGSLIMHSWPEPENLSNDHLIPRTFHLVRVMK